MLRVSDLKSRNSLYERGEIRGKSSVLPPSKSYLFVVVLLRAIDSVRAQSARSQTLLSIVVPSSLVSLRLACNVNWTGTYILWVYGWKGVRSPRHACRVALTTVSRREHPQRTMFHELYCFRLMRPNRN